MKLGVVTCACNLRIPSDGEVEVSLSYMTRPGLKKTKKSYFMRSASEIQALARTGPAWCGHTAGSPQGVSAHRE
jgi:hypothetical protein